jgi:hypothetical protein
MEISYRHRTDIAFYRTLIDRYYRQRPFLLWLPVQFGIVGLIAAAFIFGLSSGRIFSTLFIAVAAGLLICFGGVYLTKMGILLRFKSRADFGKEATVVLSDGGIASHGDHVEGKWAWAAYPRAVRFPDGILLLRRGVIRWLPDKDIQSGDAKDATELVACKSTMRSVA